MLIGDWMFRMMNSMELNCFETDLLVKVIQKLMNIVNFVGIIFLSVLKITIGDIGLKIIDIGYAQRVLRISKEYSIGSLLKNKTVMQKDFEYFSIWYCM